MRAALLLVAAALACGPAVATHRSAAQVLAFKRANPCPSTGARRGSCPGYIVDHHIALCVGGPDQASNMRWQTIAAARAKDRWECRPGWQEQLRRCEAAGAC